MANRHLPIHLLEPATYLVLLKKIATTTAPAKLALVPFIPKRSCSTSYFHVDRSPIPTDTFLCTYYGESSEILPNSQGKKKVLIPEIRAELKKLYHGADEGFESFLSEHFFDLHYQAEPNARPISFGLGHLWRLAVDHPASQVPPCIHRAPKEKSGQNRLLLIC